MESESESESESGSVQSESLYLHDGGGIFPKPENRSWSISRRAQQFVRKTSELLITVTLFSLLLSYFTGLSFLHSYTYYYFSSFLFPLFTRIFEREYMFVLCNAILVFLARKSSSSELQPAARVHGTCVEALRVPSPTPSVMGDQDYGLRQLDTEEEEEEEEEERDFIEDSEKVTKATHDFIEEDEGLEENDEENVSSEVRGGGVENDTESEGPGSNTEELNKKIEEFIRKMKQELRLEAQQHHLITV